LRVNPKPAPLAVAGMMQITIASDFADLPMSAGKGEKGRDCSTTDLTKAICSC
jgi:hypothetical protein